MGAWGLDSFTEMLKHRLGLRADLDSAGASSLNYYGIFINNTYRQLCTQDNIFGLKKKLYFPQLHTSTTATTTAGTAYVATPTDALYIRHLWDSTNDRKLNKIRFHKYVDAVGRANSSARGKPTEWVRDGANIYLLPTPDATYTIYVYYRKRPAALSDAGDVTLIGAEWDESILLLATAQSFLRLGEPDKSLLWQKEFISSLAGKIAIYAQEDKDLKDQMKPDLAYLKQFEYRG